MPLSNTRVIPAGWQQHHSAAVLARMQAWVRLSRPAQLGTRNPTTGRTPELPPRVYYEGPARIQNRAPLTPAASDAARQVATADYLVAVPIDVGAEPLFGDLCDVLSSPDPLQAGLRLYVSNIPTASILLERDLGCDLQKPATNGRG